MTSPSRSRRARITFWLTLALVALATGTLLMLLPHAGSQRRWTIHWLPGAGPMNVGLGETGVYAALVTAGACLLALAATRAEIPPAAGALGVLALLGGTVAFLAEHFLLRYVALEIVALCVALAPLADNHPPADETDRGRWARLVYLVLRIGDVGLMVGILALWSATGTLEISPALEASASLPAATLHWIAGGLLLAVWVKVGGWPMHIWQQAGKTLSLFSQSWLYRTLTPNLGLYLLYRVTPLIGQAPLVKTGALWVGALGAAWAAVLALGTWLTDKERTLTDRLAVTTTYLYAAQGGLALVLAGIGLKTTVWLTLLVLTPLRVLLSLARESAQKAARPRGRQTTAALYGLGGLALIAFNALCLWWAREAGLSLGVRLVAEWAVGLVGAWVVSTTIALWRGTQVETASLRPAPRRWAVLFLLGGSLLVACLWQAALLDRLGRVGGGPPFTLPTPAAALRALATSPAGLVGFILALWAQRLAKSDRARAGVRQLRQRPDPAQRLERDIRQGARAIHALVEAGALSGGLAGITRGILGAAHLAHRWIEGVVLQGTTRQIAQTTTNGGRLAYRLMEQGGLEGLLRRTVRAVLAGSRWLQRRHTGRLRRNLAWVAVSLALAALGLILHIW